MLSRLLFISFLLFVTSVNAVTENKDIDILKKNLLEDILVRKGYGPRIERYISTDYSKTGQYLETMSREGSWMDIDYNDRDNNWDPLHHLDRLLVMAYHFRKAESDWHNHQELLAGIERALNFWYNKKPECDNWYKNRIAKQFYFNVIALLMQGEIDPSLHSSMVNDLTEVPTMTGSNRTLLAISTFYRGVLENNPEMIRAGVKGVTDQIEITVKEGVQPDYSFHQHGHFIYNGSYGFNYLRESSWLATIVHGTPFAFTDEQIKILRDYYLEGTRWMLRGGLIDYNVRGRQVGRGDAMILYGDKLIPVLRRMAEADPLHASEYLVSADRIKNHKPQDIIGSKHFWRSDYTIHHTEKWTTSLKMCSARTKGIELNMNSENKLGYWLPYGLTYIYRKGDEYDGIFPLWNWARLPGVTNPFVEIEEKEKGKGYTQQTSFVGGVCNGKYTVSVMDFNQNQTYAKKAWFFFENEWMALGTGIRSEQQESVITTVNQVLLKSSVETNKQILPMGKHKLTNPGWVIHDSIGYIFPGKGNLRVNIEKQSGNMQRIYGLGKDTVYSQNVFTLWFEHGVYPNNQSYEYLVVPATSKAALADYAEDIPLEIISNSKTVQAVLHKKKNITGIVFHQKGSLSWKDYTIKTDEPCLILLDEEKDNLWISDPTASLKYVTVSLTGKGQVLFNEKTEMPANGEAGSSTMKKIISGR